MESNQETANKVVAEAKALADHIIARAHAPGGALKFDTEKNRLDLVPTDVVEEIAKVLTFGAKKYAARNWELGMNWSRPYGALLRHMFAWWSGQDKDPETGLSHLAHAGCCLFFLLGYELRSKGTDDRPKS